MDGKMGGLGSDFIMGSLKNFQILMLSYVQEILSMLLFLKMEKSVELWWQSGYWNIQGVIKNKLKVLK
jgi:uncharacterized protein YaaR (DUF327 family)